VPTTRPSTRPATGPSTSHEHDRVDQADPSGAVGASARASGDAVTLRYWAAAKEAAGIDHERFYGVATLAELLEMATRPAGREQLSAVLRRCSFLVDSEPVGVRDHRDVPVRPGSVIEALPPFAGG
jgi:sulfur-carrier protein